MKLVFQYLTLSIIFLSVTQIVASDKEAILSEVRKGNFTQARMMIDAFVLEKTSGNQGDVLKEKVELNFQKERMDRIEYDFRAKESEVFDYIKRYYSDLTPDEFSQQISQWKKEKSFETVFIDSRERYFRAAGTNLFLINKDAAQRRAKIEGPRPANREPLYRAHLTEIMEGARKTNSPTGHAPKTFRMNYSLRVPADTVPAGEVLRCWMPYPYRMHRRQNNVSLIESNLVNPVISPEDFDHSTIYGEKVVVAGEDTVFQVKFQFDTTGEFFDLKNMKILPYDKTTDLYKKYTAERDTHIIFTPEIKELSKKIVGDETDPLIVASKIFTWITINVPWASAREYSTVENIPGYVIENKHGDCGMVGLLLITLCRYNGIPAKWQSGFSVTPSTANLHDWAEIYFEGVGWVPADPSHGGMSMFLEGRFEPFFLGGIDSYRLILNEDYSQRLYPAKSWPRSETVDFQRGEVEWRGQNLYYNQWKWNYNIEY